MLLSMSNVYLNDATLDCTPSAERTEPKARLRHVLIQAMSVETMCTAITKQEVLFRISLTACRALQSICIITIVLILPLSTRYRSVARGDTADVHLDAYDGIDRAARRDCMQNSRP